MVHCAESMWAIVWSECACKSNGERVSGTFPFLVMLGIIVKIDSKESVFYGHTRIGKGKKEFKAWKFRTMVPDADKLLAE